MLTEKAESIATGEKDPAVEVEVEASPKERHNNLTGQELAGGEVEKMIWKSWWLSKWRERPHKKGSQSSTAATGMPELMLRATGRRKRPLIIAVIGMQQETLVNKTGLKHWKICGRGGRCQSL
jgi:hypothetical protein